MAIIDGFPYEHFYLARIDPTKVAQARGLVYKPYDPADTNKATSPTDPNPTGSECAVYIASSKLTLKTASGGPFATATTGLGPAGTGDAVNYADVVQEFNYSQPVSDQEITGISGNARAMRALKDYFEGTFKMLMDTAAGFYEFESAANRKQPMVFFVTRATTGTTDVFGMAGLVTFGSFEPNIDSTGSYMPTYTIRNFGKNVPDWVKL